MSEDRSTRAVKIDSDERLGWSSDRPRRAGGPPRKPDISVRCQVLSPTHRLRYNPGSLLLIASVDAGEAAALASRVLAERPTVLSLGRVRALLRGRVGDDELGDRAVQVLDATVAKHLAANQTVVLVGIGLDAADRERLATLAHAHGRPRHLILVEQPAQPADDEVRAALTALRRAVESGSLGAEGFHTALRLSGSSAAELKRIVFRPPPRPDDD
jgi:hypothetical protein